MSEVEVHAEQLNLNLHEKSNPPWLCKGCCTKQNWLMVFSLQKQRIHFILFFSTTVQIRKVHCTHHTGTLLVHTQYFPNYFAVKQDIGACFYYTPGYKCISCAQGNDKLKTYWYCYYLFFPFPYHCLLPGSLCKSFGHVCII